MKSVPTPRTPRSPWLIPPADELSPERPQHPGMLDPGDLKPGMVILWHRSKKDFDLYTTRSPGVSRHRVIAEPADGWVRLTHLGFPEYGELPSPAWLADMGMAPYDNGMWSSICWVTAETA